MKIAVLLSGGVDSSLALYRLIQQGYMDITAYYLKIWLEDDTSFLGQCPWDVDIQYAQAVCDKFNIELKIIPLQTEYYQKVVSYVIAELKQGRTPSPDIFCNQRVKFGAFFEKISDEFDFVASGHYAVVKKDNERYRLFRSPDPIKDQSYFLSHLSQAQLSKIMFPIGDMLKEDVRKLAQDIDLPNKDRKDSQGICFLGKIKYRDFVGYYLGQKEGDIIEIETGKKLGKHKGFWFCTIGQRQGLGIGGPGGPYYVCKKDIENNIVYVTSSELENSKRYELDIQIPDWINEPQDYTQDFYIKLRHGPNLIKSTITKYQDKINVNLSQGDDGIAQGQFCIIYKEDECLGGGMIIR